MGKKGNIQGPLAASVKADRNRSGVSQEELGERAGLHQPHISGVERGLRYLFLDSIDKLAQALEFSISLFARRPSGRAKIGHVLAAAPPTAQTLTSVP